MPDLHIENQGLNQNLREHHIEFGDDALDHFHVGPRGENKQRIGTFVRDHFHLAEQLNVTG